MAETTILDMPDGILEEIFLQAEPLELTLVCKRFNDVVSSSRKLMQGYTLFWDGNYTDDADIIVNSARKYIAIFVTNVPGIDSDLMQTITNSACVLTSIGFCDCTLKASDFKKILKLVAENITDFNLVDVDIENDDCDFSPIEFPRLRSIELMHGHGDGYVSICNFFKNSKNVLWFSYEESEMVCSEEAQIFCEFLASLDGLKDLQLTHVSIENLFSTQTLESSKFQLKTMSIGVCVHDFAVHIMEFDHRYQNFMNFIYSQRNSLSTLNLFRCTISADLIETTLNMNLKKLTWYGADVNIMREIRAQNQSLELLSLSFARHSTHPLKNIEDTPIESGICDIIKNCSSLQYLCLYGIEVTFEIALTISNHKGNLDELEFGHCILTPMSYPNIKSINFSRVMNTGDIIKTLRLNRQHVTRVKLPREIQSHWKFPTVFGGINEDNEIEFEFF